MNKPKDWRGFFLPSDIYQGQESLRLHLFFISTCFVTALFASVYLFMSIYVSGPLFAEAMAASVILFILMPFLLRAGAGLTFLVNSFLAVIAIVAILLIYWEGGIRHANVSPWVMVLPAFAMMLGGARLAAVWLAIALSIIVVFSYFTFAGISFPVMFDISKDPLFSILSMSGLVCLITFIFYISESERKKAHDGLEERNKMLDKLSNEKSKFLQIAAHDLRNPLIVIQGLSEQAADPEISEDERAASLNYINSSADRMSELIRNVLEIEVIDAGKMTVKPESFSLTKLVHSYISQTAAARLAHIEVHALEGDMQITSDAARVSQILDNYVSNAIKYSPVGSKVYIHTSDNGAYVQLSVRDEGPGINESERGKLFRQFSTLSSVPRPGEHATGLGLAIVQKIADALGAQVGCVSELGKGSTFYVRFPK